MNDHKDLEYRNKLIIDIIAEKLQFKRLSEALPGPNIYPPYLLVIIGLFIEYGIFDVYNHLVSGKSSFITTPNSLAIPAITILGIVGLRYINNGYAKAVKKLGEDGDHIDLDDEHRERFDGLVPLQVRLIVYVAVLVGYYLFAAIALGFSTLIEISGIGLFLYVHLVSFPLISIPILTEGALSYVAIHVAVPRRLAKADIDLFFYDPRNLGGFAPIGLLLKRSYYFYTSILLLWFFQTHAPVILDTFIASPYPPPDSIVQVFFSVIWAIGVLSIGYSMYRVHSIMKEKKEKKIQQLEQEIKSMVRDPYDPLPENVNEEHTNRYEETQKTLTSVQSTKTYPTTFTMWSQIFLSVLLPQALNIVVQIP